MNLSVACAVSLEVGLGATFHERNIATLFLMMLSLSFTFAVITLLHFMAVEQSLEHPTSTSMAVK